MYPPSFMTRAVRGENMYSFRRGFRESSREGPGHLSLKRGQCRTQPAFLEPGAAEWRMNYPHPAREREQNIHDVSCYGQTV